MSRGNIEEKHEDQPLGVKHLQLMEDVLPHQGSCRSGHGHHGHLGKVLSQDSKIPVVGPEVMSPLVVAKHSGFMKVTKIV